MGQREETVLRENCNALRAQRDEALVQRDQLARRCALLAGELRAAMVVVVDGITELLGDEGDTDGAGV